MSKPHPALVVPITLAFLTGCFHVRVSPLPAQGEPRPANVRGVVLRGAGDGERVEFERVDDTRWTDSTLTLTGVLRTPARSATSQSRPGLTGDAVMSRSFPLSTVSGLLVRQVNANTTSILIGVFAVGAIATAAFLLTGKTDETTVFSRVPAR